MSLNAILYVNHVTQCHFICQSCYSMSFYMSIMSLYVILYVTQCHSMSLNVILYVTQCHFTSQSMSYYMSYRQE